MNHKLAKVYLIDSHSGGARWGPAGKVAVWSAEAG